MFRGVVNGKIYYTSKLTNVQQLSSPTKPIYFFLVLVQVKHIRRVAWPRYIRRVAYCGQSGGVEVQACARPCVIMWAIRLGELSDHLRAPQPLQHPQRFWAVPLQKVIDRLRLVHRLPLRKIHLNGIADGDVGNSVRICYQFAFSVP